MSFSGICFVENRSKYHAKDSGMKVIGERKEKSLFHITLHMFKIKKNALWLLDDIC